MALIHPYYLDCVVAIGVERSDKSGPECPYVPDVVCPHVPYSDLNWIATGFLASKCYRKLDDKTSNSLTFLVTNKHVFAGIDTKKQKQIIIRFNPKGDGETKSYPIDLCLGDTPRWTNHPAGKDIAVIHIPAGQIERDGYKFGHFHLKDDFHNKNVFDDLLISSKEMKDKGVIEGDFVYILGYPMGLVDPQRQYVIARSGSIARIRDLLDGDGRKSDFLVDVFTFPGNSGGPVILKPEIARIHGTQSVDIPYVIGIVTGYVPYEDIAYSVQTQKPRVVFQENSGLTVVLPTEFIVQTIDEHFSRMQFDDNGEPIDIRY